LLELSVLLHSGWYLVRRSEWRNDKNEKLKKF
jgi:hypothetical protein